jgi:hypothetical protein
MAMQKSKQGILTAWRLDAGRIAVTALIAVRSANAREPMKLTA